MRKVLVLAAVASAALPLGAAASASAGTLDQQQTDNTGTGADIFSIESLAQTFTAGLSGGVDQVDLNLRVGQFGVQPTAPLTVEIRDASGGVPGNTVLASQSVPGTAVSGPFVFVPVTFAAPAPVLAGTQYAIVTYSSSAPPNAYEWSEGADPNPYAGGAGFSTANSPPSGAWNPLNRDFAFKTYVALPLPPKPSNAFGLAAITRDKKKGTANLTFNLPNPGDLAGTGQGAQVASTGAVTSKAVPAGAATLLVKAKGKKKRKLNETGKVKLNLTITYTPTGGDPSTQSVKVKLKKKL